MNKIYNKDIHCINLKNKSSRFLFSISVAMIKLILHRKKESVSKIPNML